MDTWSFRLDGYDGAETVTNGNRFLIGNGYFGFRGTMDEWGKAEFAAVNLAGVYDQNGDKWREPVNAPNGLFVKLTAASIEMVLGKAKEKEHYQMIDFRHGIHHRDTLFDKVRIKSTRFASMAEPNLLCSRIEFSFEADLDAEIMSGIDTDIWDINGPHLFEFKFKRRPYLSAICHTGELLIPVTVSQAVTYDFDCEEEIKVLDNGVYRLTRFPAKAGQTYVLEVYAAVCTALDDVFSIQRGESICEKAKMLGYNRLLKSHQAAWDKIWKNSAVELVGDDEASRAMNASLYHLHSISPRHAKDLSIPARGLSGQTYKGAIFWDSEIFLLPFFAYTEPELAKTLLNYRIKTLPGARKKAAEYGYRGAFYPWESQEGGNEGCTDYNVIDVFTHRPVRTYFRDKQIHISGDIVYALWQYFIITGDIYFIRDGGAEVILECARFYLSRAHRRLDNGKIEFLDIIGPDEYHERVNNNAFTVQMAAFCFSCVCDLKGIFAMFQPGFFKTLLDKLDYHEDLALLEEIYPDVKPDFKENEVIEQFDGYFALEDCTLSDVRSRLLDEREYWGTNQGVASQTQIIKQADVISMMALFPELFSDETVRKNWLYYEPRTEHGSSLSACMYALTACRIRRPDLAYQLFLKTASIDLNGGGKHWAGEIYIGGTHPAANGGAWMIAVLGFAGLVVDSAGQIFLKPSLPAQIKKLRFPLVLNGKRKVVTVTHEGWEVEEG
ncbi:MAG: glycoside hydrolase family 65 protein [Lachnospiraceae bacterium]|nr:glycoside hydrolase family 65 protein [Lachnospiraceae bacterium]